MTASAGFLLYAALYRLTVLAVGALSIWLGFRLFSNASKNNGAADSSASAEGGGFKLAFTNLLPGTYFALFGTVIISVMLWKGEPQHIQQKLTTIGTDGTLARSETVLTRKDCRSNLDSVDPEWEKLGKSGMTLTDAAEPLHKIACFYWKENRIGEAVAMAKLAALYGKEEGRAEHLALLAELLRANGDEEAAAKTEQAAEAMRRQGQ